MHILIPLIVGIISGLAINYLADVLPETRRFSQPVCPSCDENYPIRDYISIQKCPTCGNKRTIRTYAVLFAAISFSVLLQFFPLFRLGLWASVPILIYLLTILVIDYEHRLVLFETTLFGLVLCLVYGLILHDFSSTLIGGLAGFTIMLLFYLLGKGFSKIIGYVRRKEIDEVAFGFGDVSLGTVLGLLVGWPGILGAIFISMIAFVAFAVLYLIILIFLGKYRAFSNTLPFTFFLVLGAIAVFYI